LPPDGGNKLLHVEAHSVIQRLNDAFDAQWGFETVEQRILDQIDKVLVLGKLRAGDVVKTILDRA
jgi:hypothetical protein